MPFAQYVYPPYEIPLVEAYNHRFESAFVLLHPFVRVPDALAWSVTRQYPSDSDVAAHATKCSWAEVAAATGMRACASLNLALLTSTGAVTGDLADHESRSRLQRYLETQPVWMPVEGRFEPLLQPALLDAFTAAGHDRLIYVPEDPAADPVQPFSIEALRSGSFPFPTTGSLVAPDESFLFTVDWDSFFTLFYGPRTLLELVTGKSGLEGYFPAPTTEHAWHIYSMGCATVTLSPEHWPA